MSSVTKGGAQHTTRIATTLAVGLAAMLAAFLVDRFLPRQEWPAMMLSALLIIITAACIGRSWLLMRAMRRPDGAD